MKGFQIRLKGIYIFKALSLMLLHASWSVHMSADRHLDVYFLLASGQCEMDLKTYSFLNIESFAADAQKHTVNSLAV